MYQIIESASKMNLCQFYQNEECFWQDYLVCCFVWMNCCKCYLCLFLVFVFIMCDKNEMRWVMQWVWKCNETAAVFIMLCYRFKLLITIKLKTRQASIWREIETILVYNITTNQCQYSSNWNTKHKLGWAICHYRRELRTSI